MMDVYYLSGVGNERIDLTGPLYWVSVGELFDYKWSYHSSTGRITDFYRNMVEKTIEVTVSGKNQVEYKQAVEELHALFDRDIAEMKPGKLYVGNAYLTCYFYASNKENHYFESNVMFNSYKIVSETGYWITEKTYSFSIANANTTTSKRYVGRYPYRYANGLNDVSIVNEHFRASNFRMTIYGPVLNPQIIIGGHSYLINTYLESGEYLVIDSKNRMVQKTMNNGTLVNLFDDREKRVSVFREILPGRNEVRWSGKFDFSIILYEERSEPRWMD